MINQIKDVIDIIKSQDINGCITGSSLIGYFENQDVDVFVYDEHSFRKVLFFMIHNDMFNIPNSSEKWKLDNYLTGKLNLFEKYDLLTIKFLYNTCVYVNIIIKKDCNNIFSVLSSFDMNFLTIGIDIYTGKILNINDDLNASWNKWNVNYYSSDNWSFGKFTRQFIRCIKYQKRGYDTDNVVRKYIELINDKCKSMHMHLEKSKLYYGMLMNLSDIMDKWLSEHFIDDTQIQKLTELSRL